MYVDAIRKIRILLTGVFRMGVSRREQFLLHLWIQCVPETPWKHKEQPHGRSSFARCSFGKVLEAKLLCSGNPATLSHGSLNLGHSQSARPTRPSQSPFPGTAWLPVHS